MLFRPSVVHAACVLCLAAGVTGGAGPGFAQTSAAASALPPVRPLGKVTASSGELLTAVSQVRALPDGRVLVNDNGGRKVVLFDAGLAAFNVVADTTSATANAYSSRAGGLIPWKGDSTLFVDPTSLSMLVIDGRGQIARVMSVPRPQEANSLVGGQNGTPAFDAQGRLVYRGAIGLRFSREDKGRQGGAAAPGGFAMPELPDSVALSRVDLSTRRVDTIAELKIPKQKMNMTQSTDGRMSISAVFNPMQYVDDWTVTSDGRVAVVRGQEYRIDWIGADGKVTGSSKIPFAWRHLDDSTKTAFLDSTRTAMETLREQAQQRMQQGGPAALGGAPGGGGGSMVMTFETRVGGGGAGAVNSPPARGAPGGGTTVTLPPIQLVDASELPDYAPPFSAGSVRGDEDGNVWIRTSNVYDGGSVYDIVNKDGKLVDRVLLPPGRVIAGFGPGGVVYMGVRVNDTGVRLEKASLRTQP